MIAAIQQMAPSPPSGATIVGGTTGSGMSTTLKTMMLDILQADISALPPTVFAPVANHPVCHA